MYKRNGPSHSYKLADAAPMPINQVEEVQITALPISYRLSKGSKLRVSIAGADNGHFDEVPIKPTNYTIDILSSVVIPVSNR